MSGLRRQRRRRPTSRKALKGMKMAAGRRSEVMSRKILASSHQKISSKEFTALRSESLTEW
jgi:hypothetical protein